MKQRVNIAVAIVFVIVLTLAILIGGCTSDKGEHNDIVIDRLTGDVYPGVLVTSTGTVCVFYDINGDECIIEGNYMVIKNMDYDRKEGYSQGVY